MSKILVTGGTGLVGRCFEGSNYHKIGTKDGDLRDPGFVSSLVQNSNFEGIIHCASKVGGILGNMKNPGVYFYDNIIMNTLVLEEARKKGIKKVISFSSTCVFPNEVPYPLTPDKIHLGPPHDSNYAYAYAKRMGIVQSKAYKDQYGLNYFCVIPCNVYGPGDNYNLEDGHVIPSLIHRMYLAKENNEDFVVWGTGKPLREFIFSQDLSKITEFLYHNYTGSDPVIISTSQEVSIRDVVEIIANIFNFRGKIIFDGSKPDGQLRKPSDNSLIKNLLPDFKFTPIEQGLKESIEWFVNNYKIVRK